MSIETIANENACDENDTARDHRWEVRHDDSTQCAGDQHFEERCHDSTLCARNQR